MRIRFILTASLLLAGFIFLPIAGAQAHSLLVSSNPSSGAQVATSPAAVQMTFSEGVEPAFSSFAVIDRARKHYEAGAPTIDRVKGLVTLPLQPNLAPGNYVVQWKVVSVIDGHLTIGSFAFGVLGKGGASGGTTRAPTPSAPPSGAAPAPQRPPHPRPPPKRCLIRCRPRIRARPASRSRRGSLTLPCAGWTLCWLPAWSVVQFSACS